MTDITTAFLRAARAAQPTLESAEVGARWGEPSALREFTVGGLAGHLVGASLRVEEYLDPPVPPDAPVITAASYYAQIQEISDISAPIHVGIRERGEAMGVVGQAALAERFRAGVERLTERLETEPAARRMVVLGGSVIELGQYLITRVVELTIHTDDLCVSAGLEVPDLPGIELTIQALVAVAKHRHGGLAVLRALSRRERDEVEALRVF